MPMEGWSHFSNKEQMELFLRIFICSLFLVARTLAIATYEQRQIMEMSDAEHFLKPVFTKHIGTFKVLTLPSACSYQALNVCHLNEVDQNLYYEYCFKDVCEKDKYVCLNGEYDTIHICGSMPKCRKRYRNIAVYNEAGQDIVEVYSVLCPDGYLQWSVTNCFTPCREDRSVVVIRGSSPNQNALGFCNTEKSYCNSYSVNLFELSSDDDACKTVETKCSETEDLLPNCSCAVKCLPHQTRSWRSNFNCLQSVRVSSSTSTVKQTPSLTTSPRPSPRRSLSILNRDRNTENSKHSTDTKSSTKSLTDVIISVCSVIVAIVGVIIVALLVHRHFSKKEYQEVPGGKEQDSHDDASSKSASDPYSRDDEVSSDSRTVNVEKNETVVNGNFININLPRRVDITVQKGESKNRNQTVSPDISDQDLEKLSVNDDDLVNLSVNNEHDLENLKEHFNNQVDSGILSSGQTVLKAPY